MDETSEHSVPSDPDPPSSRERQRVQELLFSLMAERGINRADLHRGVSAPVVDRFHELDPPPPAVLAAVGRALGLSQRAFALEAAQVTRPELIVTWRHAYQERIARAVPVKSGASVRFPRARFTPADQEALRSLVNDERTARGWKPIDLARASGISPTQIAAFCSGKAGLGTRMLVRVLNVCSISDQRAVDALTPAGAREYRRTIGRISFEDLVRDIGHPAGLRDASVRAGDSPRALDADDSAQRRAIQRRLLRHMADAALNRADLVAAMGRARTREFLDETAVPSPAALAAAAVALGFSADGFSEVVAWATMEYRAPGWAHRFRSAERNTERAERTDEVAYRNHAFSDVDYDAIAELAEARRTARRFSAAELAKRSGADLAQIKRLPAGSSAGSARFGTSALVRLLDGLGVNDAEVLAVLSPEGQREYWRTIGAVSFEDLVRLKGFPRGTIDMDPGR